MGFFSNKYSLSKHGDYWTVGTLTFKVSNQFYITENGDFYLITRGGTCHYDSSGPIDLDDPNSKVVIKSFNSGSGSTFIWIEYNKNKLVHKIEFNNSDTNELEDLYIINYDDNERVISVIHNDEEIVVEYNQDGNMIKNFEDINTQ